MVTTGRLGMHLQEAPKLSKEWGEGQLMGITDNFGSPVNSRIAAVEVKISFYNLLRYFEALNVMTTAGYQQTAQGKVDPHGITTTYHELLHVTEFLKSKPWGPDNEYENPWWTWARREAFKLDEPTSATGRAQQFGEKVESEVPEVTDIDVIEQLRDIISQIESKQREMMRFELLPKNWTGA